MVRGGHLADVWGAGLQIACFRSVWGLGLRAAVEHR